MTSTEEIPINGRPLTDDERMDKEKGTAFDWVAWPANVSLDGDVATEYPDREWAAMIEDMLKQDGQASAVLTALTMPLRMANTTIEKPDGVGAEKITDWITQALTAREWEGGMETPLATVIGQMTRARAMKRSYHEKVFTRDSEGKTIYKKLAWRPPVSCHLMRKKSNGDIIGFKQWQDPFGTDEQDLDKEGYVVIEKPYALVYVHGQHIDPMYGHSDMDVSAWAFEMKSRVVKLWIRYCDRMSMPKTVVYGKDPTTAANNARSISRLGGAGVAAVTRTSPDEKMFDVLDNSGGGAAQAAFADLVKYLDGMMSRSVMASWIDLPSSAGSGAGSYALSADQSGIFMQGTFAVAQEIGDLVTARVIAPLVRRNFGPKAPVPRFVFEKIDSDQTDRMLALITAVMTGPSGQGMPQGIFHMLVEKLGQFLNLDDQRVRKILAEEPPPAPPVDPNAPVPVDAGAPVDGAGAPDAGPAPAPAAVGSDGQRLADLLKAANIQLTREGK